MKWLIVLGSVWWGLALACSLSIETNPQGGVVSNTTVTVTVRSTVRVPELRLTLRIEGRWQNFGQSWAWQDTDTGVAEIRVSSSLNGQYILTASADLCNSVQTRFVVMIPWEIAYSQLPWLLWEETERNNFIEIGGGLRGGAPINIEGLVTGLAGPLAHVLRTYLARGYMNQGHFTPRCPPFAFCYSVAPIQLRLYAVHGGPVGGLHQTGLAWLGNFVAPRDSRAWEIGGRGVGGVLVVRGWRHDYILLSERGDFGDPVVRVIEMPRGGSELIRRALSLAFLQQGAREVIP
jgi:hypothetical protein